MMDNSDTKRLLQDILQTVSTIRDLLQEEVANRRKRTGQSTKTKSTWATGELSDEELEDRYRRMREQYAIARNSQILQDLILQPKHVVLRFCRINNIPVSQSESKALIHERIVRTLQEEQNLRAVHPMHEKSQSS